MGFWDTAEIAFLFIKCPAETQCMAGYRTGLAASSLGHTRLDERGMLSTFPSSTDWGVHQKYIVIVA